MIFGISALVFVGLTWTVVGVVMGLAPKRGIDVSAVQFASAGIAISVSIVVLFFMPESTCTIKVYSLTGASFFLYGFLNFMMLQIMAFSMQRGPNGIIWGIIQSAVIFPFFAGIIFFNVALTPIRLAGMLLLLGALAIFGLCREKSNFSGKSWKLVTFLNFLLCGLVITVSNLPSYYPAAETVSSVSRTMFTSIGIFTGAIIYNLYRREKGKWKMLFLNFKTVTLWKFVGILQGFSLLAGYFFFYNGMNALANAGAGSIAYPLLTGASIIGFSFYSMFFLKEKSTVPQYLALTACAAGIVCISL